MAAIELRMPPEHAATLLTMIDAYNAADRESREKPWKSTPVQRREELARDIAHTLGIMRRLTDDAPGTIYATATVNDLMR
jgi:hypothetical protein